MLVILLPVLILSLTVFAVDQEWPDCTKSVDLGKTPCKEKPSIRYHLDDATKTCMAFEYTGCGGNTNNFKSETECYKTCLPLDHSGCPAGSKSLGPCKTVFLSTPGKKDDEKECPTGAYCRSAHPISICCDQAISDKFNADYKPKCAAGKKVYKVNNGLYDETLIGKNCKSKFCPAGSTCVEGNYFATCCK